MKLPKITIRVEDSSTKKILKKVDEPFAFRIVFEFGFENVLYIFRVGCYDAMDFARANKDRGVSRAVAEDLCCPFKETVAV